ncbi:mitogen-activated protein kinase kinase kinase 7-like isoform X3 [Drosophila albomicans]|uniref:Mitogen-activated protein kinase kinase kinase 7-like isoform X3 n=1 Tax=Drosophila albomicans TaxID=7291 RepID=A0A9C6W7K3_DROAB|nr:mitogen-activated protein kinase kinase kinase 7-like isoform X3 [Drosophila albomicans]
MDNIDFNVSYENLHLGDFIDFGSFGDVYKAHWITESRDIVIKIIKSNESDILREIRNLKVLKHQNIVTFYGLAKNLDDRICMIFEYANCGSLYNFLHNNKNIEISFDVKLNWMLQIAKGMEYLHSKKKFHRDLKSRNILLFDKYRTIKICDFGTVKDLETINTESIGTYVYMAPEISTGGGCYTEKCDVFSFGIVLWEVMSGIKPFHNYLLMDAIAIQIRIINGERPNINDIKSYKHSTHIKLMIEECWKDDPSQRPTMKVLAFFLGFDPYSFVCVPNLMSAAKPLQDICEEDFRFLKQDGDILTSNIE